MVNSLTSYFSEVVSIQPLHGITADILHKEFLAALHVVMSAGFHVIATICDNHAVNRNFLK